MENCRRCILESREQVSMTAISTAASSLPPVRTSCHVPLSLMTSISEETIALWLKLGALEKLEQAVLDGYGDQLCGKTSRIPQVNKFLKQVPLFQTKIKEIHQAVSQGRLRDVQHLIDRKKLAFCRDHNGASPLHKAVIFGHQDVIEYLVKRYCSVIHIRDHQGRTVLHYAAFLPDGGEIYQYLLAFGADERAMDVYGRQPSYYLDGQNESTLRQLRDGSTLNGIRKIKPRYYGQVSAGQPFANNNRPSLSKSQIRELISEGNVSSLEDLVLQGQGDRLLGETSSLPKIQSFLNIVPMYMERIYDVHRAVMRDQLEHVVILLENRKLALARDQLGATPLHKAVWFGHYKIAHYISRQFPETLNAIDMEGRTALHYAASLKDNKNMYGILVEAGANKGAFDNKGKTADYYAQYPEHLNLEEVIKRCHKVNANYLANTANRIKGKSPVRQTPPPTNGTLNSPRSDDNNGSSKENSQSNDSGNENELVSMFQRDKLNKRFDVNSANIRKWINAKDDEKLTKAVMEGYGDKVLRLHKIEDDEEKSSSQFSELVERINAIHTAVSNDNLADLQNQLEEKDFALAKDHMGMTPLHKAVLLRKTKIVGFLIEKFPETINARNKNGLTALHYAAAMSRKDGQQLYKMLIQAAADPKIRDNHGRTADYYKTHLITLPNKGIMRTRLAGGRHSETLNRYSKQGVLERMTAALQKGDVDLLQELVLEGHGKHLVAKSSWNEEAKVFLKELPTYLSNIQSFHESIRIGDVSQVKDLVSANEKLMRARDETGALPIHIAAAAGATQVLHFFGKKFPNMLNAKDANGRTALHIASQKQNHHVCKILKQLGVDAKNLDQKGRTADSYLQGGKIESQMKSAINKTPLNSSSDSMFSASKKEDASEEACEDSSKEAPIDEENGSQEAVDDEEEQEAADDVTNDKDKDLATDEDVETEETIRKLSSDATEDISSEYLDKECEDNVISTDPELQENNENNEDQEPVTDEVEEDLDNFEKGAAINETEDEENKEENLEATEEEPPDELAETDENEVSIEPTENEEETEKTEEENADETVEDAAEGDDADETSDETLEVGTENDEQPVEMEPSEDVPSEEKTEEVEEPPCDAEVENDAEENNEPDGVEKDEEENENDEENDGGDPEPDEHADEGEPVENVEEEVTNLLKSHVSEVTVAEVGSGNLLNVENDDVNEEAETDTPEETKEVDETEVPPDTENDKSGDADDPSNAPEENNDNNDNSPEVENEEEGANEIKEDEETPSNKENDDEEDVAEEQKTEETEEEKTEEMEEEKTEETEGEKTEETEVEVTEETEVEVTEENEEEKTEVNEEEKTEENEDEKTEENEDEKTEENEEEKTEDNDEEKKEENEGEKTEETEEEKMAETVEEKTEETEHISEENNDDGKNSADENEEESSKENKDEVEEKGEENVEETGEETNEEAKDAIEGQEEKDEEANLTEEKSNEKDTNEEPEIEENENEVSEEPVDENVQNDGDETKDESSRDTSHQTKDHLDELIEHWIKDGDLLRLEHVVLAGQGDRLIERTSDDKQVQDFLDLVPIYMAKIRAVHEAVAKGHLREVRSVLTRKRFALSRDHVGASPLHLAVLHGHTDVSTYIISHFPETMDGPDNEGRTPLHYAAALHDSGILYRLLKASGADEHVEDKSGHSPKYYMNHPGSLSLMQLLEPYSLSE